VLINEHADRVNSYTVWNYAEGQDLYQNAMLVDLTQPPDKVTDNLSVYFRTLYTMSSKKYCD